MEGRLPPDDDELFEWTDAPARPPRREREPGADEDEPADRERVGRLSDTEERRRVRRGETGESERSGRRPPPGRRARRRDLPARVRRRQDAAVAAVGVAVVVGLIALVSGGGGDGGEQAFPVKRLVGQTIVAQLGKGEPEKALIKRVRKGQVGGVIVESTNPQAVQSSVTQLQEVASAGD